jgi:hypothetical protein
MAHELGAAGGGFLWPRLRLISDGETIEIDCIPTKSASREMLLYLANFRTRVSAAAFEQAIDHFVSLVVERIGSHDDEFDTAGLWREVLAERSDSERAAQRRIEAMLGRDPGEAEPELLSEVISLGNAAGDGDEIAALCAVALPGEVRASADAATRDGTHADPIASSPIDLDTQDVPHRRGYALAGRLRAARGLSETQRVDSEALGSLLGLRSSTLIGALDHRNAPFALLRREPGGDRYLFRSENPLGRRFEAARLVGDAFAAPRPWHFAAATLTARQKQQRAFAAEFLAPSAGLRERLGDDRSDDAIAEAADAFEVNGDVVRHQLQNQGLTDTPHDPWRRAA